MAATRHDIQYIHMYTGVRRQDVHGGAGLRPRRAGLLPGRRTYIYTYTCVCLCVLHIFKCTFSFSVRAQVFFDSAKHIHTLTQYTNKSTNAEFQVLRRGRGPAAADGPEVFGAGLHAAQVHHRPVRQPGRGLCVLQPRMRMYTFRPIHPKRTDLPTH